jgi:hypothetical protein
MKKYVQTETYTSIHNSIIHNSQKLEITQMSSNWWTNHFVLIFVMEYYSAIK